jgi:DNA gyrase subunit A
MATKKGIVKKTVLDEYSRPREGGIRAINLVEGDELIDVKKTNGTQQILIATAEGQAVKFHEADARPLGRASKGVTGIRLKGKDEVVGMVIANDNETLLTITENGYGKRTGIDDYRLINRGGSGVINIQTTERNGKVVAVKCVTEEDELMLISKNGIIIRIPAKDISVIGRNTQGLRLMRMKEDDKVMSAEKIVINGDNGDEVKKE